MEENLQNVELQLLTIADYKEVKAIMEEVYSEVADPYWEKHQLKKLIDIFPDGQVAIKVNGEIAGCALAILIDENKYSDSHTYLEVTGNYTFDTHDPEGDTLYGVDVFIRPEYRGLKLGRRLYEYRQQMCESMNLKSIVFGGRIPNYHKFSDELKPREYI